MKAPIYKTIVSDQLILAAGHLFWCNTSQMRLEVGNSGETPQQNEQPDGVDQSALIVLNTDRRPASFIKRPTSFIKQGWQVLPTGQFSPVKTVVLTGRVKPVLPGSQFCLAFTPVLTGWSKLVFPRGKTWAKPVFLIGYREEVLRGNKAFLTGWRLTAQLLSNRFRYQSADNTGKENTAHRELISELQHSQCISCQWSIVTANVC